MERLANQLGVRADWHEPDEQDVTAQVRGVTFDNAGFWPSPDSPYAELHVVFYQDNQAVAAVNLATLCAWASGYRGES
jgi:hypothetical protein